MKVIYWIVLSALLASGCFRSEVGNDVTPSAATVVESGGASPEEERLAHAFARAVLTGDYAELYRTYMGEGGRMGEEDYTFAMKLMYSPFSEYVATCGGLAGLRLASKTEVAAGERYRLHYRFQVRDTTEARCKESDLPGLEAVKKNGRWDLVGSI